MTTHIRKAMDSLQKMFLELSVIVEQSVSKSVRIIQTRDKNEALLIKEEDARIDKLEVELEEECLKVMALYQPVAVDLRVLVAVLKINNDMERIADLAVNIAKAGSRLSPGFEVPYDYMEMSSKVEEMLRLSLNSVVDLDPVSARRVCSLDDEVDDLNRDVLRIISEKLLPKNDNVSDLLYSLNVAKHLERIADLSTNIAEEVVYIAEGKIIRHGLE